MAYNATNAVVVGAATKKTHYDRVFDNTVAIYAGEMGMTSQAALDFMYPVSAVQLGRKAKGTALQSVRLNAGVTDYEFFTPAASPYARYTPTLANVSNTAAITTFASFTLPGGSMEEFDWFRIQVVCDQKNDTGANRSPIFSIKWDGVTYAWATPAWGFDASTRRTSFMSAIQRLEATGRYVGVHPDIQMTYNYPAWGVSYLTTGNGYDLLPKWTPDFATDKLIEFQVTFPVADALLLLNPITARVLHFKPRAA